MMPARACLVAGVSPSQGGLAAILHRKDKALFTNRRIPRILNPVSLVIQGLNEHPL
jgi:hypothetical protein